MIYFTATAIKAARSHKLEGNLIATKYSTKSEKLNFLITSGSHDYILNIPSLKYYLF